MLYWYKNDEKKLTFIVCDIFHAYFVRFINLSLEFFNLFTYKFLKTTTELLFLRMILAVWKRIIKI